MVRDHEKYPVARTSPISDWRPLNIATVVMDGKYAVQYHTPGIEKTKGTGATLTL